MDSVAQHDTRATRRMDIALAKVAKTFDSLALIAAVCGVAALVPLPAELRAALLAIFVLVGPGTAVVTWMTIPVAAKFAVVPVVGLAAVSGATAILAWAHRWPPTGLLLVMVAAVVGSAVRHLRVEGADPAARFVFDARSWSIGLRVDVQALVRNRPLTLIVVALLGWLAVLPGLRDAPYSQFGLLFVGTGPGLVVCLLLIVVAFVWALRQFRIGTAVFAILAAILVQRLTVTLITEVPVYGWTYKHLGVVNYIAQYHELPPADVDIYGEWPSFFTMFAWFDNITSVDPMTIAHYFAPIVHVLMAIVIAAIVRLLGMNARTAVAAAMIGELINWVGQDYFSPQAVALVLAMGVLALLIASRRHPSAGYLSIAVFATLVPLHQLTPYWVFGIALALTVTKRVRPWWLPVGYLAVLVGYLVPRMDIVAPYGLLSGFNPVANAASNVTLAGTAGKFFTSTVCRSLSAGVILLAGICVLLWLWQRKSFWVAAVMAFSSIGLLAGQSYGGEAIFRVYLYAVPGCAILIAPLVVKAMSISRQRRVLSRLSLAGLVGSFAFATFGGLQGYFGLWSMVVGYESQVALGNSLMAHENSPATIITLYSAGMPTRATPDYVRFAKADKNFDQPVIAYSSEFLFNFPDNGQLSQLSKDAAASEGGTFIVLTRQGDIALDYYGYFPEHAVPTFSEQVRGSAMWKLYAQDEYTQIFEFTSPAR